MTEGRPYAGVDAVERRRDRRARLLEAGLDLLAAGGPAAVTVAAVGRRASLTSRYFYESFPSRDALLDALYAAEAEAIIREVQAVADRDESQADRARAAVATFLDLLADDPRRLAIGFRAGRDEEGLRRRAALAARLTAAMIDRSDLAWPGIAAAPDRLAIAAALAVDGVLALAVAWVDGELDAGRDEVVELAVRLARATGAALLDGPGLTARGSTTDAGTGRRPAAPGG